MHYITEFFFMNTFINLLHFTKITFHMLERRHAWWLILTVNTISLKKPRLVKHTSERVWLPLPLTLLPGCHDVASFPDKSCCDISALEPAN